MAHHPRRATEFDLSFPLSFARSLAAFALVAGAVAVAPPSASATQLFFVKACTDAPVCSPAAPTASSFTAGANTSLFWNLTLDTGLRPASTSTVQFPPGLFFLLAADSSCLMSDQHTSACDLGGYPAAYTGPPDQAIPLTEYLVPPATAGDLAGIDFVDSSGDSFTGSTVAHARIKVRQLTAGPAAGALVTDVLLDFPTTPIDFSDNLKALSIYASGTLSNGMPFTRMPTNCSPGPSSLTITYTTQTVSTNAAPDVDVSSTCGSLRYAPEVYGSAKVTGKLAGGAYSVRLSSGETRRNGEAGSREDTLVIPSNLVLNRSALGREFGKQVGSVAALSPVVDGMLRGGVFLTGSASAPDLSVRFHEPLAFMLEAALHRSSNSLVFSNMPDLPILALELTLFGGKNGLFETTCIRTSSTVRGSFEAQNGEHSTSRAPLTVTGCPVGRPSISGVSDTGFSSGHPEVRFALTKGRNASSLRSFKVALPPGLAFDDAKLSTHPPAAGNTCSAAGQELDCLLSVASNRVRVQLAWPALVESSALRQRLHQHLVKQLTFRVRVSDTSGKTTPLKLTLNVRSA